MSRRVSARAPSFGFVDRVCIRGRGVIPKCMKPGRPTACFMWEAHVILELDGSLPPAAPDTAAPMPEYKLIYFNARGHAELVRWIFAYGDIPYTDDRFEMEDWPDKKPTVPGGRVPVLLVDDRPLLQSLAIARYAARQAALVPEDSLEAARCDALVDTTAEIQGEVYSKVFKLDKEKIEEIFKNDLTPKLISPFLSSLEVDLEDQEWFVSGQVTWADLAIGLVVGGLKKFNEDLLSQYPAVEALVGRVLDLPNIKHWNDKQSELNF
ncbi:Hematopoietic prostaglandin D synthase [Chionoecetes opilio]|uniref:glutathione transferase n=1 Tax=Chionoecetes opilio TaxID=41210 RepID=A0A8J4XQP8_CHIOP|nr:Hematopoietic prostaglandin D synthase [Chionoecetes opilio]